MEFNDNFAIRLMLRLRENARYGFFVARADTHLNVGVSAGVAI
jgi:hypothetical protein